jgi:hypothetical protein
MATGNTKVRRVVAWTATILVAVGVAGWAGYHMASDAHRAEAKQREDAASLRMYRYHDALREIDQIGHDGDEKVRGHCRTAIDLLSKLDPDWYHTYRSIRPAPDWLAGPVVKAQPGSAKEDDTAKEQAAGDQARQLSLHTKKYYLEKSEWPRTLADLGSLLENGKKDLLDPWGKEFKFAIRATMQADGSVIERPYVWSERVVGKETKVYGEKPPEEKK